MGLFEQFPYTNFHELNLDWVLSLIKKLSDQGEELKEAVDHIKDQVDAKVLEILNQWLEDGTLEQIIAEGVLQHKEFMYSTFTGIDADHMSVGDTVTTAGYRSVKDGGAGVYMVVSSGGITQDGKHFLPVCWEGYKSWGLVGDGANDESSKLQLFISNSNDIDLGNSSFLINTSITIYSNKYIHGNGAIITMTNGLSGNGLNVSAKSNVIIEGIKFDGGNPTSPRKIISIVNSDHVRISNCEFTKGLGYAIRANSLTDSKFNNIIFDDIDGISGDPGGGIYAQGGHDNIFNFINGNNLQDHTIYIDGSIESSEILITHITGTNGKQYKLTNSAVIAIYGDAHDITISDVICKNTYTGIHLSERNSKVPTSININNVIADTIENCVESINTTMGDYQYLYLENLNITSQNQDGIVLRNTRQAAISDVYIRGCGRHGVQLLNVRGISVDNINLFSSYTGEIIEIGNTDLGSCQNITFRGVTMNNIASTGTAISITDATRTTFYNVYIQGAPAQFYKVTNNARVSFINANIGTPVNNSIYTAASIPSSIAAETASIFYNKGDICIDSTGSTKGWQCTTAGNPGTWTAL